MSQANRARFITFEGIDGAGKSTQVTTLASTLRARGLDVLLTREPGGTKLGEKLRAVLLDMDMHVDTEALLMFAARREHLACVIEPALAAGTWVLCDRFTDATYAYQVGGHGLQAQRCNALEAWVHPHLKPDLTFLFDLPPSLAAQRVSRAPDRFEREQHDFFERVRAAYLDRARNEPGRFHVIDATQVPVQVAQEIASVLDSWL